MSIITTKSDALVILIVWSGAFLGFPTVYLLAGNDGVGVYLPLYGMLFFLAFLRIERELKDVIYTIFFGILWVLTLPLEAVRTIRQ